jgi:UPF0271 protein
MFIDLNCDMGESFGVYTLGMDEEAMRYVTSANIACGFHAGDPNVMDRTVALAKRHGVGIGVHIGFPDLLGFGRRNMDVSREELINYNVYQIGALQAFCRKHGARLQHVKAHGSMSNMADVDPAMAEAIVDSVLCLDPDLKLFVRQGTELHHMAEKKGLPYVLEFYADRAYTREGTLVSRKVPGAVLHDPERIADKVLRMVACGKTETIDGELIDLKGDSVCVHGDTAGAVGIMKRIREKLTAAGVQLAPVGEWRRRGMADS